MEPVRRTIRDALQLRRRHARQSARDLHAGRATALGPWSAPLTVFATSRGLCRLIHRTVTTGQPRCDDLSPPARLDVQGGGYASEIIDQYTTGNAATADSPATSTFYYTLSTWNPYQVVIMTTTIRGPIPHS